MLSGGKVDNDLRAGELARAVYAQLHGNATVGPIGHNRGVEKLDPAAMAESARLLAELSGGGKAGGNSHIRSSKIYGTARDLLPKDSARIIADLIIKAAKSEGIR